MSVFIESFSRSSRIFVSERHQTSAFHPKQTFNSAKFNSTETKRNSSKKKMCWETERREEMWCCAASVAFFCPPLAVLLLHGCGMDFLLCCILTFFCYIPGFLHALCIVFCPDRINPKKKFQMTEQACREREKAEYLNRAREREEAAIRQAAAIQQPSPTSPESPPSPPPPPPVLPEISRP
ncbi:uncharacterized protein LOC113799088 [Dermatophagoides pteronyssinus]|uniref:uncharacterized protein LOC113799088 n=1 Tax=Dermatophagoides pteronyssinus TaxID=6956 RepID=UPI003F662976